MAAELFFKGDGVKLGEGPFYDEHTDELLWVDINSNSVNFLSLRTKENRSLQMAATVGAVIPVADSPDRLVALVGKKVCLVNRETGAVIKDLAEVDTDKEHQTRLNDGKCDSKGRLWCGTMAVAVFLPLGSLYSLEMDSDAALGDKGHLKSHLSQIGISNGLGWNKGSTEQYYIDSPLFKVYKFDFNSASGELTNQRVLVDFPQDKSLGFPDGMCTDTDGRLWIACFGGSCVTCRDLTSGEELANIPIPAKNVTSCCFGGPNFEWLFVTTATDSLSEEELKAFPLSGSIFVVKNLPLGAKGMPANRFRM